MVTMTRTKEGVYLDDKPIVDATKSIQIDITQRDVDRGVRKDPRHCAGVVAICRQEHVKNAIVGRSKIYIDRGNKWERYNTPVALFSEIRAWDRGAAMQPRPYTVRPPTKSQKKSYKAKKDDRTRHDLGEENGKKIKRKRLRVRTSDIRSSMIIK